MSDEPFIASDDRPDMTVDLERKVGDLTVRELADVLGFLPEGDAKGKNRPNERKNAKDFKDSKDQPDHKQQKDAKDRKESKDHKDQKDQKDQKDEKDQKDSKDHKDHKDHKDGVFDGKISLREIPKDLLESKRFMPDKIPGIEIRLSEIASELDQLVKRITGLEQSIEELKEPKKG